MRHTRLPLAASRNRKRRPASGCPYNAFFKPKHKTSKIRKLLFPQIWACFWREADPCWITLHFRLNIGLLRVSDLDGMTRNAAKEIDNRSRLKRCGRAAQILKNRVVVILVIDLIPLEHHTTLVLSQVFGEFGILLNAYTEKIP